MPDLFKEWLPSIMVTKKSVIRDELDVKDYNSYMVNRALSLHLDCIFHADIMNRMSHLDNDTQYQYHMAAIKGVRRQYVPWPKRLKDDDIKLLMQHFNYSVDKAEDAIAILTEEQLEAIRSKYRKL